MSRRHSPDPVNAVEDERHSSQGNTPNATPPPEGLKAKPTINTPKETARAYHVPVPPKAAQRRDKAAGEDQNRRPATHHGTKRRTATSPTGAATSRRQRRLRSDAAQEEEMLKRIDRTAVGQHDITEIVSWAKEHDPNPPKGKKNQPSKKEENEEEEKNGEDGNEAADDEPSSRKRKGDSRSRNRSSHSRRSVKSRGHSSSSPRSSGLAADQEPAAADSPRNKVHASRLTLSSPPASPSKMDAASSRRKTQRVALSDVRMTCTLRHTMQQRLLDQDGPLDELQTEVPPIKCERLKGRKEKAKFKTYESGIKYNCGLPQLYPFKVLDWQVPPAHSVIPPFIRPDTGFPRGKNVYHIEAKAAPGLVMGCGGSDRYNGTPIALWEPNGFKNQKWMPVVISNDGLVMTFSPYHALKQFLDNPGEGQQCQLWEDQKSLWKGRNSPHQRWRLIEVEDQWYRIEKDGHDPPLALEVDAAEVGAPFRSGPPVGSPNQLFRFIRK